MKVIFRLLFVFIFIFSAIYVFRHQKYSKRIEIINGYAENFSVFKGEDLIFYMNPKGAARIGYVTVSNIKAEIVDSLLVTINNQEATNGTIAEQNFNIYTEKYSYNTQSLKQGLYFLGSTIPFLVKEPALDSKIKVMLPVLSFQAVSNRGGKSFINYNSTNNIAAHHLSLKRTIIIDDHTKNLCVWLDKYYTNGYELIPDYEMQNFKFKKDNVLIIYGNTDYIPLAIKKSLEKKIDQGIPVFAISATLFQHLIRYNKNKKTISYYAQSKYDPCKIDSLKTGLTKEKIFNANNFDQFGLERHLTTTNKFDDLQPNVFYFRNNLDGHINVPSRPIVLKSITTLNGVRAITAQGDKRKYDFSSVQKFDRFEILAEIKHQITTHEALIGNIVYLKKSKKSGQQVSIGNSDWLETENLNDSLITNYTKSIIDFLLQPH